MKWNSRKRDKKVYAAKFGKDSADKNKINAIRKGLLNGKTVRGLTWYYEVSEEFVKSVSLKNRGCHARLNKLPKQEVLDYEAKIKKQTAEARERFYSYIGPKTTPPWEEEGETLLDEDQRLDLKHLRSLSNKGLI